MKSMINKLLVAGIVLGISVVPVGCSRSKAPDLARMDEEAMFAATQPVNILDTDLRNKVAADAATSLRLPDGRLKVKLNLRNSSKKDLDVLVRVVFKDAQGMSTGDETEWTPLFFAPQQIQTFIDESRDAGAGSFTVEVRKP